jgi:EAL domain-containing protein (putative c-di-GMP-specific phosphodiesterase class I)
VTPTQPCSAQRLPGEPAGSSSTTRAQAVARLIVEDQLRDAITAGQFVVYYQPIVALADSHVVGHEALVRWAHPTRGLLGPREFLDVAEDSGLIKAIGAQVLDQACAMLAARPDLPGPVSVNVSAVQLSSADWLRTVTDALAARRVDPARLVLEVTETAAIAEGIETQMQAHVLHTQGWECGQGYYFGRPAAMPISGQTTGGDLIA